MFTKSRVRVIKFLVELNEKLFFNPKLIAFYKAVNTTKKLNVFIDIGANVGQTIDMVLKVNGQCKIYAFELNPKLFQLLKNKYKNYSNVILFSYGISNKNEETIFYENVLHSTSSLEELNYDSSYLKKKSSILGVKPTELIANSYKVNVKKLSTFIKEQVTENNIGIIKIDTEGHEYACLEGLFDEKVEKTIDYIQLENHKDDMYKNGKSIDEISSILNKNTFELCKTIKHGFGDIDELIFKNNNTK